MSQNSNILYLNYLKKVGVSSFLQDKPNSYYEIKNIQVEKTNISKIKDLNDFESFIKKAHPELNKNLNKIIIGDGNYKAKIFIIGEFSEEENEKIKPLGKYSSELLIKMLEAINLNKKDVYISNAIPLCVSNVEKINNEEIIKYLPYIQRQIEIVQPKIILLMGPIAVKAILNSNLKFDDLRGKWHEYKSINLNNSIPCLATYHPNYLIKFPKAKKYSWDDLKKFQKKIKNVY